MRRFVAVGLTVLVLVVIAAVVITWTGMRYAYEPSAQNVMSRTRPSPEAYDLWGRVVTREEAAHLLQTSVGRMQLSPRNGAVKVDDRLLRLGRESFYKETFGNEIFLSGGCSRRTFTRTSVAKASSA